MSLLPYVMREVMDDFYNPTPSIYDQHFGLGLLGDDLLRPSLTSSLSSVPLQAGYLRPWRFLNSEDSGVSNIVEDKNNYKVNLDVQQFKPEEISVKLSGDSVLIEGKHEERKDKHGFISRQFSRRYKLPDNVDIQKLESQLSSDGVLSLIVPKKINEAVGTDRQIPIKQTNQPALKQEPSRHANHKQPEEEMEA